MARVGDSSSIAPTYGTAITVRVVGAQEAEQQFRDYGSRVRAELRRTVESLASEIRLRLTMTAPRKTGFLRSKIGIRFKETTNFVGASVFPQGKAYLRGLLAEVGYGGRFWVRPAHSMVRTRVEGPIKLGGRAPTKLVRGADKRAGHWRTVQQPPRPWAAPVGESMRVRVMAALEEAIQRGVS